MRNMYIYKGGREFKRINRRKARAAYNNGLVVLCVPCNLNPCNLFVGLCAIYNRQGDYRTFEERINQFEYYNCTDSETGHYTAFYIPNKTIDAFTGGDVTEETINTIETYDYSYLEEV